MAVFKVSGLNGNLTVPGANSDWAAWNATVTQTVDDTTGYQETNWTDCQGSGVSTMNATGSGFTLAGGTNTTPGLCAISQNGGAATLTAAVGCTYTGTFVVKELGMSHRKIAGATPMSYQMQSKGIVIETWATS